MFHSTQSYSTLRHELGNSVNSLTITLEVLIKNYDMFNDDIKISFLERSLEQVGRQKKLLEGMKLYESLEPGEVRDFDFHPFISDFLETARKKLAKEGVRLSCSLPEGSGAVRGNPESLGEALFHLVDNSLEAMSVTDRPRIDLSADWKGDYLEICLADNGSGIPEDILPDIFSPFFSTREDNLGLGLSITEKLIRYMKGEICAGNLPDGGTTMRLRLPAVNAVPCDSLAH